MKNETLPVSILFHLLEGAGSRIIKISRFFSQNLFFLIEKKT
jgi:hypothetical protein